MATEATSASHDDEPTTEFLAGAVGDRCANCQAPLASDQRYCVNCGQRRGKPRFSADTLATQAAPVVASAPAGPPAPHQSRFSPGATLIAGVATLLLALGVGFLIGDGVNKGSGKAPAQEILTVGNSGSGAGASTTTASTTASSSAATGAKHTSKGKAPKTVVVHLNANTEQKAAKAASQVIGSGAPKNPTVQQGQSCSSGQAGCQNGKFTGNFFSGN
jgi:hypothetical protein